MVWKNVKYPINFNVDHLLMWYFVYIKLKYYLNSFHLFLLTFFNVVLEILKLQAQLIFLVHLLFLLDSTNIY